MIYKISSKNRGSKFLDIEFKFDCSVKEQITLQLPVWRPGRYELGDFAKNIQKFEIRDSKGKLVRFRKISKSSWLIIDKVAGEISVNYNYYSDKFDAGSTWVDNDQIYVNPVNCLLYVEGRENQELEVVLDCPKNYTVATSLKKKSKFIFRAKDFDELADSPFIASASLQKETYKVGGVDFYIWFQGECKPEWKKIIQDFKKFTKAQLKMMGSFPFKEYHFLFQIAPYKTYHGVEHLSSTVIALGPGCDLFGNALYKELLGVSSHELFHAWNIKTIRPEDMLPYDFTKENYSELGYLAEGVTTYYGDLFLLRSGIFSLQDYLSEINKTLDRHFLNYGHLNKSVTESSLDTWLDGYSMGIPNRKSSIYVEGCLLAFCTDVLIRKETKNKYSLDDVLRVLYNEYAKQGKGISNDVYIKEVSRFFPKFRSFFNKYYLQANGIEKVLKEVGDYLGLTLERNSEVNFMANNFGCYMSKDTNKVLFIAPDSPADVAGITSGDELVSINNIIVENGLANNWAKYFDDEIDCGFKKDGKLVAIGLKKEKKQYFVRYKLIAKTKLSNQNSANQKSWLK